MIDAMLLAHLRRLGVEDGRIRFLHDAMATDIHGKGRIARYVLGPVIRGSSAYYDPNGNWMTGDIHLDHGVHWNRGRIRIARRSLPETVAQSLVGEPLASVVEFEGAEGYVVERITQERDGSTRIHVQRQMVDPPGKATLFERIRYTRDLRREHARMRIEATGRVTAGDGLHLAMVGAAMLLFLAAATLVFAIGSQRKLEVLAPLATLVGIAMCLFPAPKWNMVEKIHDDRIEEYRREQGW